MKHLSIISYYIIALFSLNLCFAEETYNLEILFRCTGWASYPDLHVFGIALAGGDVNGDGYSDIAVEATHYVEYNENFGIDVYVFFGEPVMDTIYDAVLHCPEHLGHSPSGLCISDVNGDSIGDVIVGDYGGGGHNGEVFVFFGGLPFDTIADLHLVGETSASSFGRAVAAGDVNGDGCDDIIVGAYAYNFVELDGRVYVYYGGSLLDSIPDIVLDGHDGEAFGKSVGSGGDLNSDGYEDLVVGADENHEAYWGAGKIYVFFGGDPMDTLPDCWLHGEGFNHFLGWFGCDIMEVDNDHDLMITGTSEYPNGWPGHNPGKTYILYGGDPMDTLPDAWMIGQADTFSLGMWCCSAGDVNGDGFEDAVVGAPHRRNGLGTGYVWLGGMPMDTIVDAYLCGGFAPQQIGWEVASAGDVNGDSYDDVIFSNYAGADPAVWICKYTGTAVTERMTYSIAPAAKFTIYPNPFSRQLTIGFEKVLTAYSIVPSIHFYDVTGREVMSYVVADNTDNNQRNIIVDTRNLPTGVYFVDVQAGEMRITHKVIKIE